MNIMIISDDHGIAGFAKAYKDALKTYGTIDALIHAGDTERGDNEYYSDICDCPVYIVRGNNDYNDLPNEIFVQLGGKKIFVTHGHMYGVYMGVQKLYYAGLEKGADIVVYGHTHFANHQKGKDVEIINPGSLTGIRSGNCSYAVLIINEDETTKVDFRQMD